MCRRAAYGDRGSATAVARQPLGMRVQRRRVARGMGYETDARIGAASQRAADAAERTARAHERAAQEHERHAAVAGQIGDSIEDAHRSREQAQRLRAAARRDQDVAESNAALPNASAPSAASVRGGGASGLRLRP
jgi:hypothetical protein